MQFKTTPPEDLLSRMFMLEFLRELGPTKVYAKAKPEQKKALFYKLIDDSGKEEVDFNWENLLFVATILQIEGILKPFLTEIQEIENKRQEEFAKMKFEAEMKEPVSVSVYDLAKARMDKKGLLLPN
jgi:hypothetical protein